MKMCVLIYFFLLTFVIGGLHQMVEAAEEEAVPFAYSANDEPDIKWFREEMRIAPQYVDPQEGILGMSWLHFFIMLFLILFFIGALIAYYRQTTRTTRILQQLLSKEGG